MRFSYDTAAPGMNRLAQAFAGGNRLRKYGADEEEKSLANMDLSRAKASAENAKAAGEQQRTDYLNDAGKFISDQSGAPLPLVKQFLGYQGAGNWGTNVDVQMPRTGSLDDTEGVRTETPITTAPDEIKPFLDAILRGAQTYGATRAASASNPDQIAKSQGEYQGQGITSAVQALINSGKFDQASAVNQGGKLGQQIKRFDNVGNTGAVLNPATGEMPIANSRLAAAFEKGQRAPAGYEWTTDENGNRVQSYIPGGPADPANRNSKITDSERMAAGYASRMDAAEGLMGTSTAGQMPGIAESTAGSVPLVGRTLANLARNDDRQKYRQAQEDWVRAKLRKESGAVIGEKEMDDEIRTYFPQIGDHDDVIAQKSAARQVAMDAMRQAAGLAYKERPPKIPKPTAPTRSASGNGWSIKRRN